MRKSRKTQLVYLSAACTVGVIGILASAGLFEAVFRWDFYIYFTNISNYLCVAVLFAELWQVIRSREDGYINAFPKLKFAGLVAILLTFFMFNIIMAPSKSAAYLLSVRSVSLHILIPILYTLDWFLFYERGGTNRKYPLFALSFPISYLAFVLLHAAVLRFDSTILCYAKDAPLIYPYFFLNYDELGAGGLIVWVIAIIASLVVAGYLLCLLDKICARKKHPSDTM